MTAAAMIVAGVATAAVGAQTRQLAGDEHHHVPGYPPPGGIYKPFTDCPLRNPLMQETPPTSDPASGGFSDAACVAGNATTGSIKIGNITTPVTQPVHVQFGFFTPPNGSFGGDNTTGYPYYAGGVLPPPDGLSAMLVTKPDPIPGSLLQALGCPSSNASIEALCKVAQDRGGRFLKVYALAQSAGQLTNFGVFSWTQRIKIQLINPLLGNNCYIGSDNNPIVLNPQLGPAQGGQLFQETDPNPVKHPDTLVLGYTLATVSDSTFTAPGVTGCGPSGLANVAVDEAVDAYAGLPSASGSNSLSLTGWFGIAVSAAGEDTALTQPQNNAKILLSAFLDSSSHHGGAGQALKPLTLADLQRLGLKKLPARLR